MSRNSTEHSGRVMYLLTWISLFLLLFAVFHFNETSNHTSEQTNRHGRLVVSADAQGHYWINGTIHDHPVKFLVDTGATMVAFSKSLAQKLGIEGRYPMAIQTANGPSQGSLTRIQTLSFGDFSFHHVKALILENQKNDTALLGMNILSEFKMSQNNNQLILER